ncbi:hypothetical protein MMC26_004745 [Xylographa opegraphella]|nr:hypothetical protein [Xylographa opegraphella]
MGSLQMLLRKLGLGKHGQDTAQSVSLRLEIRKAIKNCVLPSEFSQASVSTIAESSQVERMVTDYLENCGSTINAATHGPPPDTSVSKPPSTRLNPQVHEKHNIIDLQGSDSDSDSDSHLVLASDHDTENSSIKSSEENPSVDQSEVSSQSPLAFRPMKAVVNTLRRWRKENDDDVPPGASKLVSSVLRRSIVKRARMCDDQDVEVARFKIDEEYMGWFLKEPDGMLLYVNVSKGRGPEAAVMHHAWLGDDRGFPNDHVAKSWGRAQPLKDAIRMPGPQPVSQVTHAASPDRPQTQSAEPNETQTETLEPTLKRSRSPSIEKVDVPSKCPKESQRNVTFLFYVCDPTLGAIPMSSSKCNTVSAFCDAALTAFNIMAKSREHDPTIVALQISWERARTALVMPWRDAEAFERIMKAIRETNMKNPAEITVEGIEWYLDQLQQSKSNMFNGLSELVDHHGMTSFDAWVETQRGSPLAKFLPAGKLKNVVEDYLQKGAGELFWPSHSLDPSFKQLQWSAETDRIKITTLVLGLTCLITFHRLQSFYNAAPYAHYARQSVVTNDSATSGNISENQVNPSAPPNDTPVRYVSPYAERNHPVTLATAGNSVVQGEYITDKQSSNPPSTYWVGETSNRRFSDFPPYLQGDSRHKYEARRMLQISELAMVSCTRCVKAGVDCYMKYGRKTCVYCTARGLRVRDCQPCQTSVYAVLQGRSDMSTLDASPIPSLSNIGESFTGSDVPTNHELPSHPDLPARPRTPIKQEQSVPKIIFLFFASHSGEVPIEETFSSHSTMDSFFDEAYKVWHTVDQSLAGEHSMTGVAVSWDQNGSAATIKWREQSGYDSLMSQVMGAVPNRYGEVIVEVKCISQMSENEAE